MFESENIHTEPMRERERRVLEHIDYVLEQYDKFNALGRLAMSLDTSYASETVSGASSPTL